MIAVPVRPQPVVSHQAYFDDQANRSNPEFWSRFGSQPVFAGARVLDVGCGHGALTLDMARLGAHVVGVDIHEERICWAQKHVAEVPVAGSLAFVCGDVTRMGFRANFDLVVTKDAFEHVDDLSGMLACLRVAMKPHGELWAGFSPLYHSPYGDHGRTGLRLPWAHTLLPGPIVYAVASRHRKKPIRSARDLDLNAVTPAQFRQLAAAAGLSLRIVRYNCGEHRLMPALSWLRRYSFLERYVTVSIYAVLVPTPSA